MSNPDRYAGKPLVRLLEMYVLWSIGKLPPAEESTMVAMAPTLERLYKVKGSWQQIIAAVMEFPDDTPQILRSTWDENLEIARQNNLVLEPQHFAEMIVDENFMSDED